MLNDMFNDKKKKYVKVAPNLFVSEEDYEVDMMFDERRDEELIDNLIK
jgi:hypothetical protein